MATKTIILLGIGHTNAHIVRQWIGQPIETCRLVCVSNFPTATYSGMLPGTLGWQFQREEMSIDLKALCKRAGAELIVANVNGLDLRSATLHFDDHEPIAFDALSVGVGSMPVGWRKHRHAASFVPIKPMQSFLSRFNRHLDTIVDHAQRSPVIAVVGGGVATVEIALCLQQQCDKRNLPSRCKVEIYTGSETVANGMKSRSVGRIEKILGARDIPITTRFHVTEVGDDYIGTSGGRREAADVVIWATGAAAPSVLSKLNLQTDDRGFIATSKTLQSLSDPRVFAVGDCGTILESPSPKAGVYAVRQCPVLWHNLRAILSGGAMKSFKPQSDFLKLLNTGDGRALLEYGSMTMHSRWCWHLKTWIDKRFVSQYQVKPADISE
ncbi:MAG: FAD-dependent oxidoreductase [Pirellulaceae bacterium]